ncbi:MAG: hypothetical protein KDE09_23935 [Anaerolineales bacterium]|nr:hypothetical protein [Anaerolineales bacterium]
MFAIADIEHLLPFVLQPDNIARLEEHEGRRRVAIGNRKLYPLAKRFVYCDDVEAVAVAIEAMVTQGAGPWQAAACGLALAAYEADDRGLEADIALGRLEEARLRLVATRPTNTAMARRLELAMAAAQAAATSRQPLGPAIESWLAEARRQVYADYISRARFGAELIADGDGILTMCFAEAAFILALALAHEAGKRIHVYVPETRPYLQGAKLTAPSIHELGIPVTLIGDNMASYLLAEGKIQKYFTAADLVTLDGHVVNKVGTFQHAIVAAYHGVPYFVFNWGLDVNRPDRASIEIELRDPAEMKAVKGVPTTHPDIDALYPAFDITPPHLVAGVITRHGVVSPYDLHRLVA